MADIVGSWFSNILSSQPQPVGEPGKAEGKDIPTFQTSSIIEIQQVCPNLFSTTELRYCTPQYCLKKVEPTSEPTHPHGFSPFYAFHGSPTENWRSIVTVGLGCRVDKKVTRDAFGSGVYLSTSLRVATDFTRGVTCEFQSQQVNRRCL
eukprot:PhF_6_TR27309/c0_g1_i2/m.40101